MHIDITPELLTPYLTRGEKHAGYTETVNKYNALKVHADGEYPFHMIDERRPFEAPDIKRYRLAIYEPVTRDNILRVMASLTKIRRSVDWNVKHPTENYPPAIPEHERLHAYDERLPLTETLESWLFTMALKNYLLDANAVVLITPVTTDIDEGTYLEPFPVIYNSNLVVEFKPNELLIVQQMVETEAADGEGKTKDEREVFLVVNDEFIQRWVKTNDGLDKTYEYRHGLGVLPAYKLRGQYYASIGKTIVFESRIAPMLPRMNDAAREYSDLQAEVVQHIHSEKWVWASEKCPRCVDDNGFNTGFINDTKNTKKIICPECNGNLKVASSPFLNMVVRPTNENLGETPAPLPPAGYITKPTDIVTIQDERINKHLYKALASINFQFLDQTPLNISGKGKEIDRDELNNFVYSVAEDLVRIMKRAYGLMVEYRYRVIVKDPNKRRLLIPEVIVPQKFDLLGSNYLTDEIDRLKKADVNPVIVSALEVQFAAKKFYGDTNVSEVVQDILLLDPLSGVSEDDKMLRLSNGGITKLVYITSANIIDLVKKAYEQNKDFHGLEIEKKREWVDKEATAVEKEINALKIELPPVEQEQE